MEFKFEIMTDGSARLVKGLEIMPLPSVVFWNRLSSRKGQSVLMTMPFIIVPDWHVSFCPER